MVTLQVSVVRSCSTLSQYLFLLSVPLGLLDSGASTCPPQTPNGP